MNQTVCNNQPPSILMVDIPHLRSGTTRMILYRGDGATELFHGSELSVGDIDREALNIAATHMLDLVLVTGAEIGTVDHLRGHGIPATYHRTTPHSR